MSIFFNVIENNHNKYDYFRTEYKINITYNTIYIIVFFGIVILINTHN